MFYFALYILLNALVFHSVFSRKGRLRKKSDKNLQKEKNVEACKEYFSQFKIVSVESDDRLILRGYFKDNSSDKTAILIHGFCGSHYNMIDFAKLFEKRGYNILVINQRAHGISDGNFTTLGYYEGDDLKAWINFVTTIREDAKIVLYGISMGGTIVCMNASENCSPNVVLAISDCAFDNAYKIIFYSLKKEGIILKFFVNNFLRYSKITREVDFKKVDLTGKLKNTKIPMLFVHGDQDDVVPLEMVYSLSNQVPEYRRQLFISRDAKHIESYKKNPKEFETNIDKFLTKYNM